MATNAIQIITCFINDLNRPLDNIKRFYQAVAVVKGVTVRDLSRYMYEMLTTYRDARSAL